MQSDESVNRDALRLVGTMLRFVGTVNQHFRETSAADLSLTDLRVLWLIEQGTDLPSAIADTLHVDRPRVTRSTDRLAALGYITRDVDEADRRRCRLGVTAAGREWLQHGRMAISAAVENILEGLPPEDIAVLRRSLESVRLVLDAGPRPAGTPVASLTGHEAPSRS